MIRIPYGISDFESLVLEQYYYIDRTKYLELLEQLGEKYVFIVRPRRFGKSLFVSTLQYYYGLEYKEQFQELFGQYYIGKNPTPLANSYLVLKLSFAGIHTETPKLTRHGFLKNVKRGVQSLMAHHPLFFSKEDQQLVDSEQLPSDVLQQLYNLIEQKAIPHKLYVLIDEYDHFANELLAFDFANFKNIVSRNGFVRKFYETLKDGTSDGLIGRIFITGITPITLDSLTSGFNIASKLTTDARFNQMFGFTQLEVADILQKINIPVEAIPNMLQELAFWYNGYLFNEEATTKVYNPDMVLFFAKQCIAEGKYPKNLLDTNIASDYRKVRNLFKLDNRESENIEIIQQVLTTGMVTAQLTREYSFEKVWTHDDLISLLFYQGILTIKGEDLGQLIFKIPNAVIQQLYFKYFHQLTLELAGLNERTVNVVAAVLDLVKYNNLQPILEVTQNIIGQLAVEDRRHLNELTFKAIFTALFYTTNIFKIYSEFQVRKSKTEKGRVDLLLLERPPYKVPYQFVFELKYIPKKKLEKWKTIKKDAIAQLKGYLQQDEGLQDTRNLAAYVLLFSAKKSEAVEVKIK